MLLPLKRCQFRSVIANGSQTSTVGCGILFRHSEQCNQQAIALGRQKTASMCCPQAALCSTGCPRAVTHLRDVEFLRQEGLGVFSEGPFAVAGFTCCLGLGLIHWTLRRLVTFPGSQQHARCCPVSGEKNVCVPQRLDSLIIDVMSEQLLSLKHNASLTA
ncbi:hypothetical protein UY3_11951 [Chelonia mydas]|uniref:Uncharacterized protein n=1 Tax=Chelonia mydas TaxID=8469 RepID=M7BFU8_CHEMY|nr:hypothetical protein UY3_11951 [Chelonia mydas]